MLNLLWLNFYVIGPILSVVKGQILKSNLAIWSHYSESENGPNFGHGGTAVAQRGVDIH